MTKETQRAVVPKKILGDILRSKAGVSACNSTQLPLCVAKNTVSKQIALAWQIAIDMAQMRNPVNGVKISKNERRDMIRVGISGNFLSGEEEAKEALIDEVWKEARRHVKSYSFFLEEERLGGFCLERAIRYAAESMASRRKLPGQENQAPAYKVRRAIKYVRDFIEDGEFIAMMRGSVAPDQREYFIHQALRVAGVDKTLAETIAHLHVHYTKGRSE